MKKIIKIFFIATIIILAGCNKKNDVVKIGVVAPLTGAASPASKYCVEGFEMAINELNSIEGGIRYEIQYEDCQSDPNLAGSCYKRLELQGAKYIIALGGQFALTVAPMTKGKDIIYFTTADYNESVLTMTDCGFRVFPSANTFAEVSAQYMIDSLNVKKVATITMNTVPCLMSTNRFEEYMKQNNVEVVYQDKYDIGTSDFRNTIAKMSSTGVEAVFFNGFGISPAAFCSQLSQYRQFDNLIVMGDVNFSTKAFTENNKNNKLRIYYADSEMSGNAADDYYEKNNVRPNSYVNCCYMMPFLINDAIENAQAKGNISAQREYLKGHSLTTPAGDITFDQRGNSEMEMKVYRMK